MSLDGLIEDLLSGDVAAVIAAAELLAQSVPDPAVGLVPYTSGGYPRYLAAMVTPPANRRTAMVRLVRSGGVVAGVADWRLLGHALFLNGIAVRADVRGRGFGRRLLADGVLLARALHRRTLALDVARDNAAALRFYRRGGFVEGTVSCWHDAPDHGAETGAVRFRDWPLFQAGMAAYGFGDISIDAPDGSVARIRVVGDALRVVSAEAARLPLRQLRRELGAARTYVVRDRGEDHEGRPLASFVRMHRALSAEAAPS